MKSVSESMIAIFKSDQVYFYKEYKFEDEFEESVEEAENKAKEAIKVKVDSVIKNAIWHSKMYAKTYLYGNRVTISNAFNDRDSFALDIDGIPIKYLTYDDRKDYLSFSNRLRSEQIISYLNAIVIYGLDFFLENYKKILNSYVQKVELLIDEQIEKFKESGANDSDRKYYLDVSKKSLKDILCILFLVQLHLPLGIENEHILNAYEKIQNLIL
jgi:hypothetical protein